MKPWCLSKVNVFVDIIYSVVLFLHYFIFCRDALFSPLFPRAVLFEWILPQESWLPCSDSLVSLRSVSEGQRKEE